MSKIWAKDYELDSLIEEFTVGNDYELDLDLVEFDCIASMAHAKMLSTIGILSESEYDKLETELQKIIIDVKDGNFIINRSDEDGHTAIESRLTQKLGDIGKKIHTGRSRNDQVITATRLYSKSQIKKTISSGLKLVDSLIEMAQKNKDVPMVGRTHMQSAMPSSVGLWAGAFAEEILDDVKNLKNIYQLIDQNPLGSAASYGVPLPLNRELTGEILGFKKVQNNVLYVNNSRGKFESIILDAMDQVTLTLSKMAQDLILFSLPEFDYFSLPKELCSGSSIMPQKKNPDGFELIRSKSAIVTSCAFQIKSIIRSLPTGYNRDFQDTKEPFMRGCKTTLLSIRIMELSIQKLEVNVDKCIKGFTPENFATDVALEMVAKGASFRDAYVEVGLNIDKLANRDPVEAIKLRTHTGTSGNLGLDLIQQGVNLLRKELIL
ncbi:MAG: argininosuccinate lyase [Spirochaetales bacterium]|nr:argininosuccinate lyase [Spirochaetales bacterium]